MTINRVVSLTPDRCISFAARRFACGAVATVFVTLLLTGCATRTTVPPAASDSAPRPPSEWTACAQERPRVCTMEYAPVCARLGAGGEKTYPSKCNACADIAVAAWREDACKEK